MRKTNAIRGLVFSSAWRVLLYHGHVYEGISCPIKPSHSHRSLHAAIHFIAFAVRIHIRTNGITLVLILCARIFVAFAFVIRIIHKGNLSLIRYVMRVMRKRHDYA